MIGELPLSPQVFSILTSLIEDRAGLTYALDDRDLLASKVSARAVELGYQTVLDYYYYLRYDADGPAELSRLVELLLVHETFFFRELDQLEMMMRVFLAPLVEAHRKGGRRPRVWSAACSTGEEPLTVAMLLADRGMLGDVDIVASDLSGPVLERARSGLHGRRAIRVSAPAALAARHLTATDTGWRVAPELLAAISWHQVNLIEPAQVAPLGTFDIVLCRNALFYFKDSTAMAVVRSLTGRLVPGGALFVGVAESLLRFGGPLVCEEHGGVFVYRKPGAP